MDTTLHDAPIFDFTDWIGRRETTVGRLTAQTAAMAHATLETTDSGVACPRDGEEMPPLWHWYAFPPTAAMDQLGIDGHPHLGGFLPPVPFERRMWASGALSFDGVLRVGEEIEKRSTIANVVHKEGSTGGMVFVSVDHALYGQDGLAVQERQEIVYLPIAPVFTPPPKRAGPTEGLVLDQAQTVSAALLFRYSAITFNTHRIHYDLQYAQEVEHYPGLVVHGPLQATLLMAQATRLRGRVPDHFKFRGVHPLFEGEAMHLRATQGEGNALALCTVAGAGHMGMQATADWEG